MGGNLCHWEEKIEIGREAARIFYKGLVAAAILSHDGPPPTLEGLVSLTVDIADKLLAEDEWHAKRQTEGGDGE